jgi:hypothetical protein
MRKLTTAILVLSLVMGGVALAIAADAPQTPQNVVLSGLQKLNDQEAREVRGLGMEFGPSFGGFGGVCPNPTCVPNDYNYNNSQYNSTCIPKVWLSPGPHKN